MSPPDAPDGIEGLSRLDEGPGSPVPSAVEQRQGPLAQRASCPPLGAWFWASAAVLLIFVAGRCLVPMDETDLFYNLRLGEIILTTRSVPRTNLLSFTKPTFPDPNLAWVFQIVLALAHRAGGIPGTVLLKTVFVVATFALLLYAAVRRGAHPVVAALALALAAWAAEPRFVERPHLVTFLGLAYLIAALARAEMGAPRWLLALVPLGVVWANGNSCFFLAPGILALYAAGARIDGRAADARRAALVAACLVPLAFATPSGTGVVGYIVNHFRMPALRPLQEYRTAEWPLDGPFFFLLAGITLTAGALAWRTGRSRKLERAANAAGPGAPGGVPPAVRSALVEVRYLLPIAALGLLGARRIRFVAELALVGGPVLAVQATRLGWSAGALQRALRPAARRGASALALGALAWLALAPRLASWRAGDRVLDLGLEADLVPVAAIDWLEERGLRERLYNDLEVGSYLTWRGWPRYPVFQDPRINGYPEAWHALLRRTDLTRGAWEGLLARHGVRAALVSFPSVNPRAALFDPVGWALVYRARDALVFARRTPANEAVIQANELPLSFRFDPRAGAVAEVPLQEQPPSSTLAPCVWQRRLGDLWSERREPGRAERAYLASLEGATPAAPTARPATCPLDPSELRVRAAAVALELDHAARAAALLEGLTRPDARMNRGFALLALGRPGEALTELRAAREGLPDEPQAAFGVGLAAARAGRPDDARAALRDLLRRWPRHFAAPEARRLLEQLEQSRTAPAPARPAP